jgi:undecaprenyl-diphosphatase
LEYFQTLLLALIQGLTEFLPISSSAHLILPFQILGWQDQGLAFDVAVHLGSLFAVLWFLRTDIFDIFNGLYHSSQTRKLNQHSHLGLMVLLASLPILVVGYLAREFVEAELRTVTVIAYSTILFGVLLGLADRKHNNDLDALSINWIGAILIGFAQCFALIPGTSRSGVTMTAALLLGLSRSNAVRFSFLMSIPAILGASTIKVMDLVESPATVLWDSLLLGMSVAAVTAYLCIRLFINHINKIGFMPFVIYRLLLGMGILILLY